MECAKCAAVFTPSPTLTDSGASRADDIPPDDKLAAQLRRALSPRIQILRLLAGGGMSVVYLGREPSLRRLVAIKVLAEDLTKDDVARARFTREAEAAAAIVDPHVINIYQVGTLPRSRRPYILMQFVDGPTLQQEILASKIVPEVFAKVVVGEIARALSSAHAQGVVHRDIKPANVVIDRETGRAIVLDFGISAAISRDKLDDEKLTREGVSVGTPPYMSPEQAAARDIDEKTDIYSLGILAFEFVTGHLPINADTPEGYIAAHLQEAPPDVREFRTDLDQQFADLINQCLKKDPGERPSADDVARALIPPSTPLIEWPPPGLEVLRGLGSRFLRSLLATAGTAVTFFALLLYAPAAGRWREFAPTGLLPLGSTTSTPGGGTTVLLFLLTIALLASGLFTLVSAFRGWRLADLMSWARGLGYPWTVVWDVALDSPDTTAIVNGHGVYALSGERRRRQILALKRLSGALVFVATTLAVVMPALWVRGVNVRSESMVPSMVTASEAVLLFVPAAVALSIAMFLRFPQWAVRNRARRWQPFMPLTWTLPKVQKEAVAGWLTDADRNMPGLRFARWPVAFAPFLAGTFVGILLFGVLALTLSVTVTAAQWSIASRDVAAILSIPRGFVDSLPPGPVVLRPFVPDETPTLGPTVRDMMAQWFEPGLHIGASKSEDGNGARRRMWRSVAPGLSEAERRELRADAAVTSLETWRSLAATQSELPFWIYDDLFNGAENPREVPLLIRDSIVGLAHKNESAAILAADVGDTPTALRYARQTLAIGLRLREDPMHGWLAHDVFSIASRMMREIGLLQGDRNLLLEAERLDLLVEQNATVPWLMVRDAPALMGDAVGTEGMPLIADTKRYRYERWWAVSGVVTGFCRSPREILFGIDDERRATLRRAAEFGSDLPHMASWVELNVRWLNQMQANPTVGNDPLGRVFTLLQFIGLDSLAARIRFCRGEIRNFTTSFSEPATG